MLTRQLPWRAPLADYDAEARALLDSYREGDADAESRFKWEHPRFRGRPLCDVKGSALDLDDAQTVIAHEYSFDAWPNLAAFTQAVHRDAALARFETAVEAVIDGDAATLGAMLAHHPDLARARSSRRHHCTLLHYLGANGVEGGRQRTPLNAVAIMTMLLDAGAEADATADLYENKCTTMSMVVTSSHPARAGVQAALAELLLDRGAALDGPGSNWQSAVLSALQFGYGDTAAVLAKRAPGIDHLAIAAGLGRADVVRRLLPAADVVTRHAALALAAQHGHTEVVELLLDAGEDLNRRNPSGYHDHATPLHQAIAAGHPDTVRLLVDRGARLDARDSIYHGTPLGWAIYCDQPAIADYLRARGAPER
jgi:ankyrin repeat protein